jgi:ribulose 1,5-bisphosphate synthetase/thiazole synthase
VVVDDVVVDDDDNSVDVGCVVVELSSINDCCVFDVVDVVVVDFEICVDAGGTGVGIGVCESNVNKSNQQQLFLFFGRHKQR